MTKQRKMIKTIDRFKFDREKLFFDDQPFSVMLPHNGRTRPNIVSVTEHESQDYVRIGTGSCCNGYVVEFKVDKEITPFIEKIETERENALNDKS